MDITFLGTGNAQVTACYNTCFVVSDGKRRLLVDGGGGNQVLVQLERAGIAMEDIHEVFVTHKHIDHLLGIIWVCRIICERMLKGTFESDAYVYGHDEVIGILEDLARTLLAAKHVRLLGDRLHFVEVSDGERRTIIGHEVTFFDIASTKAKQFGFRMELGAGKALCCCGDEPYNEREEPYARGATWLLHEAFCLHDQADIFHPYEKHHSTARDAAELAERLGVQNLVLYHTEDKTIAHRRDLYTAEASQVYSGCIYVPDDLNTVGLE